MRHTLLMLALLWVMPVVAQQAGQPAAKPTYVISGTVVSGVSGAQPLSRTRVAIVSVAQQQQVQTFLTTDDGRFWFQNLAPGKYQLIAEHAGFPRQSLDQHDQFSTAVAVGEGLDSTHLVFRMQPGATVSGTVIDEYLEPVRGANVALFRRSVEDGQSATRQVGHTQTDEQGSYRFDGLFPGTVFVVVMVRPWYAPLPQIPRNDLENGNVEDQFNVAYPTTFYADATDSASATPIMLHSGERASADIRLRAVPAVHVRIKPGNPGPGKVGNPRDVVFWQNLFPDVDRPVEGLAMMWGPNGGEITGLAPGRYVLHVQGHGQGERTEPMVITGDVVIDPNSIAPDASIDISGTVITAANEPLPPESIVRLTNPGSPRGYSAQVGGDGKFEIPSVEPGTYQVMVANMDGRYVQRVSATGAHVSGRSVAFEGVADPKLTIVVGKGLGTINGTAMQGGRPVAGVMILALPDLKGADPSLARRDQSDSDGTFTLPSVVPGKYTVMAIGNGWDLEWADPAVIKPYLAKGAHVEVQPNTKYDIKLEAQGK